MKRVYFYLLLVALAIPFATHAQDSQPNPAVAHLMEAYGIDQSEAQKRIDLQLNVAELSDRLNKENDPTYADMYIKHTPKYNIVVMFAGMKSGKDNKAFLDSVDPKIRRYVKLKNAKRPRGATGRQLDQLNAALRQLSIPFTSEYNLETQMFLVTVGDPSDVERVESVLPRARRRDTIVEVGILPQREALPTGVRPGDRLYGGNPIFYTPTGGNYCTLGYAVNYTSGGVAKKGILTAGHCADTVYVEFGDHDVTLSGPVINRPGQDEDLLADKYDYQIFDVTGLTVDNTIVFKDINGIPEFPATGTFRMTAISTFLNQKAGMVVCKSGHTTGITCGEIVNGNKTWDGVAGWIEVSRTQQADISAGGDSGSPWFYYPGTSSTITGVGIHTAGGGTGYSSTAIYMPIDYIDDHITSVNTIKQ